MARIANKRAAPAATPPNRAGVIDFFTDKGKNRNTILV
jgi:hypothetical protein